MLQENLGADLGFDLGLAAAPAPQNGLDGTADFFVNSFNIFKFTWFNMQPLRSAKRIIRQSKVEQLSLFGRSIDKKEIIVQKTAKKMR